MCILLTLQNTRIGIFPWSFAMNCNRSRLSITHLGSILLYYSNEH